MSLQIKNKIVNFLQSKNFLGKDLKAFEFLYDVLSYTGKKRNNGLIASRNESHFRYRLKSSTAFDCRPIRAAAPSHGDPWPRSADHSAPGCRLGIKKTELPTCSIMQNRNHNDRRGTSDFASITRPPWKCLSIDKKIWLIPARVCAYCFIREWV